MLLKTIFYVNTITIPIKPIDTKKILSIISNILFNFIGKQLMKKLSITVIFLSTLLTGCGDAAEYLDVLDNQAADDIVELTADLESKQITCNTYISNLSSIRENFVALERSIYDLEDIDEKLEQLSALNALYKTTIPKLEKIKTCVGEQ
jgi:hypothetical protein